MHKISPVKYYGFILNHGILYAYFMKLAVFSQMGVKVIMETPYVCQKAHGNQRECCAALHIMTMVISDNINEQGF